jgi:hypothetical protein
LMCRALSSSASSSSIETSEIERKSFDLIAYCLVSRG